MKIQSLCPHCKTVTEWEVSDSKCPCGFERLEYVTDDFKQKRYLNQCPLCGCTHVYRQKDFNRTLGVGLIVIGAILSFWTYGISLLLVTLIDVLIYRAVPEVGICYKCEGQFRKAESIKRLESFNLSLFDYYKNLKNNS